MAVFCFGLGIVFLAYYLVIIIYAGITADFAWIWLFGALVLGVLGGGSRYGCRHPGFFPGWLPVALKIVIGAWLVFFWVVFILICRGMAEDSEKNLDYVIVLGAQVKGDKPSRALKMRLDRAAVYARQNKNTILILSGGQGSGEDITEASCMAEYLMEGGISADRLILEEKSTTTKENLEFSDAMTGCKKANVGILSNNFHITRACALAKKLGYEKVSGIAAASDPLMQPHFIVREVLALVKEKLSGNI